MIVNIKDLEQTENLAKILIKNINFPVTILLIGDLGAGKTTFTKFLAKYLNIDKNITSPTFSIINSYIVTDNKNIKNFRHSDLYRISSEDELYDIGYETFFGNEDLLVIEWANLFEDYIIKNSQNYIKIIIKNDDDIRIAFIESNKDLNFLKEISED